MSKPLTEEQKQIISWSRFDLAELDVGPAAIDAALARLDFLERKVFAAERLARKLATSNCLLQRERAFLDDAETYGIASLEAQIEINCQALKDYDEVE